MILISAEHVYSYPGHQGQLFKLTPIDLDLLPQLFQRPDVDFLEQRRGWSWNETGGTVGFSCVKVAVKQHVRFQDYTPYSKKKKHGKWCLVLGGQLGCHASRSYVSFRWEYKQTELKYDFLWGCLMRLTAGCIIDKVRHLYVYRIFSVHCVGNPTHPLNTVFWFEDIDK